MDIHTLPMSVNMPMCDVICAARDWMRTIQLVERAKTRTVVVLEEAIRDANEAALLIRNANVIGEDAVVSRGRSYAYCP